MTDPPPSTRENGDIPFLSALLGTRPRNQRRRTLWEAVERRQRERLLPRAMLPFVVVASALVVGLLWAWSAAPAPGASAEDTYQRSVVACAFGPLLALGALAVAIDAIRARRLPRKLFASLHPHVATSEVLRAAVSDMILASGFRGGVVPYVLPTEALNACLVDTRHGRLLLGVTDGLMREASREELAAVVANLLAAHLTGATAGSLCDAEALMLTKDPGPMLAVLERVLTGEHRIAGVQLARHAGTALAPGCDRDADAARLAAFRALVSEGPPAASVS